MNGEDVGRRIRSWIVDAGITQEILAEKLGVSASAVKGWVYGFRSISFDRAEQICDVFGKSLDELVCRDKRTISK